MRFHDVGQVFNAGKDSAELCEVFYFNDEAQVSHAAVDVYFYIGNVDAFI